MLSTYFSDLTFKSKFSVAYYFIVALDVRDLKGNSWQYNILWLSQKVWCWKTAKREKKLYTQNNKWFKKCDFFLGNLRLLSEIGINNQRHIDAWWILSIRIQSFCHPKHFSNNFLKSLSTQLFSVFCKQNVKCSQLEVKSLQNWKGYFENIPSIKSILSVTSTLLGDGDWHVESPLPCAL